MMVGLILTVVASLTGCAPSEPVRGVVTAKSFVRGGCATGVGISSSGGTVITTNCWSDSWAFVVHTDTGEDEVVDVSKVTFVRTEIGGRYDEVSE